LAVLEDPRSRNQLFPLLSIETHTRGYAEALSKAMVSVDWMELDRAISAILDLRALRRSLWVAGNGGSAAIADHLLCDWMKGTYTPSEPSILVRSLVACTAMLTAVANDFSYEDSFSRQLEMQGQAGDLLLTISSSGNSANILSAIRQAKTMGIATIALTGFNGGEASKLADISIHVAASNYGVVEDCHQALMHNIAQYIHGNYAH